MSGLWQKELRSACPFLVLVIVLTLFGLLYELFSGLPNSRPLAQTYSDYVTPARSGLMFGFVLVFALASGLLVREYDEGTMEFLDALPVSRSRVFAVKVTVTLLILLLVLVLDIGTAVLLHALSRNSLDQSFHLRLLATALFLRGCQLFVVLSLGLALSFLRRFGWLVLGVVFWSYIFLRDSIPSITVLDLFAIAEPQFEGDRWIVPQRLLMVQLGLGAVLMATAYGMFLGVGDRLCRGLQRLTRTRRGNACLFAGGVLLVIVGGALGYRVISNEVSDSEADENGVTIVYPSWSTSRARSTHFEFIYPTNLSRRAQKLISTADAVHEKVRMFFGTESGDTIVVDATSVLPRHAGLAFWDKIRLDLSVTDDNATLQSILGHETSHVFLERLSDSRLSEQMNSTRFFHEGVASYVEYHSFRPERAIETLHSVAAVMHSRGEVKFNELIDSDLLSARRDTDLVYPLGEVFVEALVERYGEPAVGKLVRALTRDDAPGGLSGLDLWRDVFQACNYSLDDVLGTFFVKLDAAAERNRDLIDMLPRLRGMFFQNDTFVSVQVLWKPIDGWKPICRFRQSEETSDQYYLVGKSNRQNVFYQARAAFPGASLWFQLGLSDAKSRVIYEPWVQVTLD